jgi:DNA sulfur modification protein DndB
MAPNPSSATNVLDPSDGNIVGGVILDQHRFAGRMKGAQLLKVATDPRRTEDPKQVTGNTELENLRHLRLEVQRLFDGAKEKNVESYAKYIVQVHERKIDGMAPPIILYAEKALPVEQTKEQDGISTGRILIPWRIPLVAIDGETQLAARFEAANINPETADDFVPVVICHGKDPAWARQVFYDLNLLGVRPNAAIGLGFDQRDPLTHVAREVEQHVAFFKGRVHTKRRQLRGADHEVVTITALRGACITLAESISGVKYGTRPVHVPEERLEPIRRVALEWFDEVSKLIGPAIEDRERYLAGAPPVLAAIGAMGHTLVGIEDEEKRAEDRKILLAKLKSVNWEKTKHWEGIAGKFTPKGTFAVGGSKETAYTIYGALTNETSVGFHQIRPGYIPELDA